LVYDHGLHDIHSHHLLPEGDLPTHSSGHEGRTPTPPDQKLGHTCQAGGIEIDLREMVEKNLSRPLRMLFTEPILIFIGIYLTFVYGLIYIILAAYALVYDGVHGMSPGLGSLPFWGICIGILGSGLTSLLLNKRWVAKYEVNGNKAQPEWRLRLPLAMVGGVAFCLGLLWFGWTGAYHSVHWIVPTVAGGLIGFGLLSIFMQLTMYIVDAYLIL